MPLSYSLNNLKFMEVVDKEFMGKSMKHIEGYYKAERCCEEIIRICDEVLGLIEEMKGGSSRG